MIKILENLQTHNESIYKETHDEIERNFNIPGFECSVVDEFEDDGIKGYNLVYSKDGIDVVEVEVWEEDSPITVNDNLYSPNLLSSYYDSFDSFAADLTYKITKYMKESKLESLQHLKEFDKPVKVSNKNYKRTLNEISNVITAISQKELIPKACNEIIEDIYYKVIELKNMFSTELENKSIKELEDAIELAYERTDLDNFIEEFVADKGVSNESETIFVGLSDEDITELYDLVRDKLIKQYGPDYDELNSRVYDAFNLMI